MLRQQISARIAAPAVSAAALLLAGCGSTITGTPVAAPPGLDSAVTTTSAKPSGKPSPGRPTTTTTPADKGGDTDFQASIGDCVKLGGTTENATIHKATCGSKDSNYKVVAKAPTNSQCPTDVDQAYYETMAGIETGAICLDIDWVINDCLDLGVKGSGSDPKRIDCSTPGAANGVKVLAIMKNSTSVDECSDGDSGFVYDERKIVICVNTL
ncbi:hypothetical protein OHB26_11545 [Nocardia sp. NBC_01503]|uniref:LppU family putative lipoprotein n=1 Tax=Nocardia sp. NBC_01503 TaxID=2975997 RepID=UPI002E7BDB54|nr:hypothetical protein [Nocardia sp. NBC_01503]WTL34767.1 hypothetical protein OHB26_11545 [Nocardia sp. NBC_01503]